jgi:Family of unknown function (DUF6527)
MLVSRVLRTFTWKHHDGETSGYIYWCPGCDDAHHVWTRNARPGGRPVWSFDGNLNKPTFSPSVRHFCPARIEAGKQIPERTFCHYFVTAGEIRYCGDCKHALNGQTVPLPDLPPSSEYSYGDD